MKNKRIVWKSTTPDPDITLTANTLALLLDRAYRYYGINCGCRHDVMSDIRLYGSSNRGILRIWRDYEDALVEG